MITISEIFRRLFRVDARAASRKRKPRRMTTEEQLRALDKLIAHIKQKAKENGFDLENDDDEEDEL